MIDARNKEDAKSLAWDSYDNMRIDSEDEVRIDSIKRYRAPVKIWDAEHPHRKLAMSILEHIESNGLAKFHGEDWYAMEDWITIAIHHGV